MTKLAAHLTTLHTQLTHRLNRAASRDTGSTVVEYVVITAGVIVIAIGLVALLVNVVGRYEGNIR